jgi:alanine dehydrogenase
MKIGILRESKTPADSRTALTPLQCVKVESLFPGIRIIVQSSPDRCFADSEYVNAGIAVRQDLSDCDMMLGVKEVKPELLIPEKTYLFFSHTIKMQPHNRRLLKTILNKRIRLIDYETITDEHGFRLIGFGRWAGIIGAYNGIRAWCIRNHMTDLIAAHYHKDLLTMKRAASLVNLPGLRIAVTGGGRVASGSEELLSVFGVKKVTVKTYLENVDTGLPVYVQLDPGEYVRTKSGEPFSLHHFIERPEAYESHFSRFLGNTDLLIMAAFWDPRAPVLFNREEASRDDFRIRIIADITCDMNGSVPTSVRTTTHEDPYFDFDRKLLKEVEAFSNPSNITVMAIDNLPCGLPREASVDFGETLISKVFPHLLHRQSADIISRATLTESGRLTARYSYLADWINKEN